MQYFIHKEMKIWLKKFPEWCRHDTACLISMKELITFNIESDLKTLKSAIWLIESKMCITIYDAEFQTFKANCYWIRINGRIAVDAKILDSLFCSGCIFLYFFLYYRDRELNQENEISYDCSKNLRKKINAFLLNS